MTQRKYTIEKHGPMIEDFLNAVQLHLTLQFGPPHELLVDHDALFASELRNDPEELVRPKADMVNLARHSGAKDVLADMVGGRQPDLDVSGLDVGRLRA